jgi:hypothetical protein
MNSYAKGEPGTTLPKSDKRTTRGIRSLKSGFDRNHRLESRPQIDFLGVASSLDAAGRTEKR